MDKRLTKTAMSISIGLIFTMICTVFAFFFGLQFGTERTEAKYAVENEMQNSASASMASYQQQDLVSFYHTVFLPYREFQNEWIAGLNKLASGATVDAASLFKDLSKLAEVKSKEASSVNMKSSPMLAEAQISYIRSLNLFKDAASTAASSSKSSSFHIEQDETYLAAVEHSLIAQQSYYNSMLKWAASVDLDIPAEYSLDALFTLEQWKDLPLIVKNKLMSDQLLSRNELVVYYPHDLSSQVDFFIQTRQATDMKLMTLSETVELLMNTKAVRAGDFITNKGRLYQQELLPQLPFFYPDFN